MSKTLNLNKNFSVETENLSYCPLCHSKEVKFWCNGWDRLHKLSEQKFIYSKCKNCKIIFLSLRPIETEIYKFYPEEYEPYKKNKDDKNYQDLSFANSTSNIKRSFLSKITTKLIIKILNFFNSLANRFYPNTLGEEVQHFYEPYEQGLTLLDFGCGSDTFLNHARNLGWDTIGIDFSEIVVQNVRSSGHKAFVMSPHVWNEIENESIDFVRISHVLEHLYHPKEVLEAIKLKMKPGATLHIIVPNPQGISARIFRSSWLDLDCPRHIMLYFPSNLESLLLSMGFCLNFRILQETLTSVFARSCGYVMHDLGLIEHSKVHKMIDNQVLANVLNIPMKIASTLGMADRFHIFVKK